MIFYSGKVHLVWENDLSQFRLTETFWVRWNKHNIEIEKGFLTDLASIPRVFRSLIPQIGHHLQPAVVHDWLYGRHEGLTRLEADQMLLDGMRAMGVSWARRKVIYRAVRLGGGRRWRKGRG